MKYPVTDETNRYLVLKYNTTEKQLVCDQRPGSNPLKVKALDNYYPRLFLKENSDSKFSIYSWLIINAEMSLGFQIRGCYQYCGGHNLPPLIGIGLTELQKSGGAKAPLAPPLTTALWYNFYFLNWRTDGDHFQTNFSSLGRAPLVPFHGITSQYS